MSVEAFEGKYRFLKSERAVALAEVERLQLLLERENNRLKNLDIQIAVAREWIIEAGGTVEPDDSSGGVSADGAWIRPPTIKKQVLEFAVVNGKPFTPGDFLAWAKDRYPETRSGAVYNVLAELARIGTLKKPEDGVYMIPSADREDTER
jgi:hypothetical protein